MSDVKMAVAVLDIGTTGVRMLVGRITDTGAPKIIAKAECSAAMSIEYLDRTCKAELVNCINKVVKTINGKTGIEVRSCYVSMSNRYVRPIESSGSISFLPAAAVTGLNIGEVLNEASAVNYGDDELLIDIVPVAYFADGKLITDRPEGTVCSTLSLDAEAIVARKDAVSLVSEVMRDAELKLDGFIPTFLSSQKVFDSYVFYKTGEKKCFTVIADVGGDATEFSVYYNGIPFAFGAVGVGGNKISYDVEKVLSVSASHATRLKFDYPYASAAEVPSNVEISTDRLDAEEGMVEVSYLADIMNARISDIAEKTIRAVKDEMISSGITSPHIDKVYFIGDGIVNFKGVTEVLEGVVSAGSVEAANKGKDLGIKNSFVNALGMLLYISSKIKYGRKASVIINRNESSTDETEKSVKKGKDGAGVLSDFWRKVKKGASELWKTIKDAFRKEE